MSVSELDKDTTVFIFCAAKGDISSLEAYCESRTPPSEFLPLLSSQASFACKVLGVPAGRTIVVSDACASGATGIEIGRELLVSGRAKAAVVFGFDGISRFVATGFHSLSAPCRPRARGRSTRRATALPSATARPWPC